MCHTPEEVLIKSSSSSKLNRRLLWGLLLRAGDDYVVKLMALSLSLLLSLTIRSKLHNDIELQFGKVYLS